MNSKFKINDIVMFIRDVIIYDKHGESIEEIKIGEQAKIIGFNNTPMERYLDVYLIKKNKEVYNIHNYDVIILEDESMERDEKVLLT